MSPDDELEDLNEPETLPEEIVHWQPTHRPLAPQGTAAVTAGAMAAGASGTAAIGALAIGVMALGALAIGALAIGRLRVGDARFRRLEIDDLVVRRIRPPGRR